ncbi:PH domain-containing protein [Chitinophaga defluvii]|uniref:PH domain-containing protein n=1 Tax=Chitinophaga defluvii TaxID=3163343 RepID=A0ABV2T6R0_9BACT
MDTPQFYHGFAYAAKELYQFIAAYDYFTILLDDGDIIHFTASDPDDFRKWLTAHNIPDIRKLDGWVTR